jgi:hypothetical protein
MPSSPLGFDPGIDRATDERQQRMPDQSVKASVKRLAGGSGRYDWIFRKNNLPSRQQRRLLIEAD